MSTKILVATDFSEDSERALAQGIDLAQRLDAQIELVHVETVPPMTPTDLAAVLPLDLDVREAKHLMNALQARIEAAGVRAAIHVRVGPVVAGILDAIDQLKPAMVVVGSHGRGAVSRILLGSTSESLVRRSPAPVLIVPSPKRHPVEHAA